jgi:hypothetical protein
MTAKMKSERVAGRIDQGQHALLLVILHQVPEAIGAGYRQYGETDHQAHGQPGEHDDNHSRGGNQQRGAQVRLACDQDGGHDDDHAQNQQLPEARRNGSLMQVPGGHHRHGQLHDFGWLEADTQVEPAPRALANFAGGQYQHE